MEPTKDIPPFDSALLDDQTLMMRRLRPDIGGRAWVEVLDPATMTRINLRHGDSSSPMMEDMLRPEFMRFILDGLAERKRSISE